MPLSNARLLPSSLAVMAIDKCSRENANTIFDAVTAEPRIEAALELRRRLAAGTTPPLGPSNDAVVLREAGLQRLR